MDTFAMRAVSYVVVLLIGVLGTYLILEQLRNGNPMAHKAIDLPIYLSFLSVMLTAVTVVLTALGIGIGVLAAYTFRELKAEAKAAADKVAREVADETAKKRADEALSEEVIWRRLIEITENGKPRPWDRELEPGYDPTDTGER